MNKILLLSPETREEPEFPIGIAYVASSLMQNGYRIVAHDLNFVKETEFDELLQEKYIFIGITGFSFNINSIESLIREIRHKTKSPIVLGGTIVNSYPEFIANNIDADFFVYGEGEKTSVELARYLSGEGNVENVNGIYYRNNRTIKRNDPAQLIKNLDEIPFPAWDEFKIERYFHKTFPYRKSAFLISSRGCIGKCTFCYRNFEGKYRTRSPKNVVSEIAVLKKRYGVEYVHFRDECFYFKESELVHFCDLMIKKRVNIGWSTAMRLDGIKNEENYGLMEQAGCDHIHFGIETGSLKMMQVIKKEILPVKMIEGISAAMKHNIYISSSYLLGMPGEDINTLVETYNFALKATCNQVGVYFPIAFPGSWLYDYAKKKNIILDEIEYLRSITTRANILKINFTNLPEEILLEYRNKLLSLANKNSRIKNVYFKVEKLINNRQYYVLIKMILYYIRRLINMNL